MHKSAFSVDEANVGVLLTTTNISKSSAEKRLNQVSRYAPGKCYRLFFQRELKKFDDVKKSDLEILDLSTLLLHLLALENSGTMLSFLQDLPSPPDPDELEETLGSLSRDGLIEYNPDDRENTCLTPLGRVVGTFPVPNRVGRMLMMGLVLRAIDSALTVASLLAVPEVFTTNRKAKFPSNQYYSVYTSDVVRAMEAFFAYVEKDSRTRRTDPYSIDYQKCMLMKEQLEGLVKNLLKNTGANDVEADWATWNANDDRLAALAGLLCVSTPRVAHLVSRSHLVTNDYQGTARIHPNSVNAGPQRRAHWYLYNESKPSPDSNIYLDVTTAVSPVELALFSEGKPLETMCDKDDKTNAFQQLIHKDNVIFLADGWIPVSFMDPAQLHVLKKLRNLLRGDMLQQVVQDPHSLMTDPLHEQLIICVLDAIEHHRKANP
jgi:HrpA-like RNA helicase